jgi:hypothetical protein
VIELRRYRGYVVGVRIGGKLLLWDALTARAIRKAKGL